MSQDARLHAKDAPGVPVTAVLSAGLALAVATDYLLRAPIGLNLGLLFAGLYAAVQWTGRKSGLAFDREAQIVLGVGLVAGLGPAVRDSEALAFLAFLVAAAAFAAVALRSGRAWVVRGGLANYAEAVVGAGFAAGTGVLGLALRSGPSLSGHTRLALRVLVGVLIATPLLVLFGVLFLSADQVFATLVADFVRVDLELLLSHVFVVGAISWLASGYLWGVARGTELSELRRIPFLREVAAPGRVGIVEVGTALALVDLLFLVFVVVQLRYLFGGAELVEVTPGLTYAEYARSGFAELALASALVVPSLLLADFALRRERPRDQWVFGVLGGINLALLGVILLSGAERLRAYHAAYGLTEARFYAAAFLVWLAVQTALFAFTVLPGARHRFAPAALFFSLAMAAAVWVVNPQAWVVRANVARVADAGVSAGPVGSEAEGARIDGAYLASLDADAVPALTDSWESLGRDARCLVAEALLVRWGPDASSSWRGVNWSEIRARREVRATLAELEAAVSPVPCPRPSL